MAASQEDIVRTVRESILQVLCALHINSPESPKYYRAAELLNHKWKTHESIHYIIANLKEPWK